MTQFNESDIALGFRTPQICFQVFDLLRSQISSWFHWFLSLSFSAASIAFINISAKSCPIWMPTTVLYSMLRSAEYAVKRFMYLFFIYCAVNSCFPSPVIKTLINFKSLLVEHLCLLTKPWMGVITITGQKYKARRWAWWELALYPVCRAACFSAGGLPDLKTNFTFSTLFHSVLFEVILISSQPCHFFSFWTHLICLISKLWWYPQDTNS